MTSGGGMTRSYTLGPDHPVHRMQRIALAVGVLLLGGCVAAGLGSPQQFFRSYLIAYLFWFGIGMGSLVILMLHHVAGGGWGAVIRRLLESSTRTLPLMALLFLPIIFGMHGLYEWSHPEVVAHDEILRHKAPYLNEQFWLVRAVVYFAVWLILVRYLNRWSLEQDQSADAATARRLELISRGGLVLVVLTMTFASIDWVMSLEPHWASTIFGVLTLGGQVVSAMAFTITLAAWLASGDDAPLGKVIAKLQFHDLGKLQMAFIMVWAYLMLSQFLIIWSANLPEEIPWYINRSAGGWQYVSVVLLLSYFVVPFLILLSRDVKRRPRLLATVACAIIVARVIELFWFVIPAFHPGVLSIHWMDAVTLVGVGGVWLAFFLAQLKGRSLVAINDPSLPEVA